MAPIAPVKPWSLVLPEALHSGLHEPLFPGDHDEHGAVIEAGIAESARGVRLLAREVLLARDGVDYVPGTRGSRQLVPEFIGQRVRHCRDERLVYLAVHNHGGRGDVAFSSQDMASHERGYPALLDIARGMAVGALVFSEDGVAGDIWMPDQRRAALTSTTVVGRRIVRFSDIGQPVGARVDDRYERQSRLFGDAGQAILARQKVGVIGSGGVLARTYWVHTRTDVLYHLATNGGSRWRSQVIQAARSAVARRRGPTAMASGAPRGGLAPGIRAPSVECHHVSPDFQELRPVRMALKVSPDGS